jgi:hypothetical protein
MLYPWSNGEPVFGRKSHPCSWVYVSCDRSTLETDRTLRRLGLTDWDAPIYAAEEVCSGEPDIAKIYQHFPDVDLYVIEGIQACIPDSKGSQNKAEMNWALKMRREVLSKGKTILATTHVPKLKKGDGFANGRANMLGSASLIGCVSTVISIQAPSGDEDKEDDRVVIVRPRDAPNFSINYSRDENGRFIDSGEAYGELQLEIKLEAMKTGEVVTTEEMLTIGKRAGLKYREKVQRLLKRMVDEGIIARIDKGKYQRLGIQ